MYANILVGCMRMRKLGFGQSVALILPEEISTKVYERTRKDDRRKILVEDVLLWCIGETWSNLKASIPLWAVQGHRYESSKHFLKGKDTTEEQGRMLLEPEAQSLEARYRPTMQDIDGRTRLSGWDTSQEPIAQIVKRCEDFGAMGFSNADLEEEQEVSLAILFFKN
jgi:hypothetical protein